MHETFETVAAFPFWNWFLFRLLFFYNQALLFLTNLSLDDSFDTVTMGKNMLLAGTLFINDCSLPCYRLLEDIRKKISILTVRSMAMYHICCPVPFVEWLVSSLSDLVGCVRSEVQSGHISPTVQSKDKTIQSTGELSF